MSMTLSAVSSVAMAPLQIGRQMASSPVLAATVAAVQNPPNYRRFNLHYAVFPPQLYVQLRDPDTGEVTFQAPNKAEVKMAQATQPVRSLLPEKDAMADGEPTQDKANQTTTVTATPAKRDVPAVTPRGDALNTSA